MSKIVEHGENESQNEDFIRLTTKKVASGMPAIQLIFRENLDQLKMFWRVAKIL
jgi:hypothetical protein